MGDLVYLRTMHLFQILLRQWHKKQEKAKRDLERRNRITKCSWMRSWNEKIEIEIGRDMKMMGKG